VNKEWRRKCPRSRMLEQLCNFIRCVNRKWWTAKKSVNE
jgi:hypothetical protein